MIMLSFAGAYAQVVEADSIAFAPCADDYASYPDCREEFTTSFEYALDKALGRKVSIFTPFINTLKTEIVKIGLQFDVPYHLTHTCYKGTRPACGVCDACVERISAFQYNKVVDPIPYEVEIDWQTNQ
jgi:7-cyano-7-deazaguanine synthase